MFERSCPDAAAATPVRSDSCDSGDPGMVDPNLLGLPSASAACEGIIAKLLPAVSKRQENSRAE